MILCSSLDKLIIFEYNANGKALYFYASGYNTLPISREGLTGKLPA